MSRDHQELENMLKSLGLGSFLAHYQSFAEKTEQEGGHSVDYLYELSKLETETRSHRRIQRLIKQAKLPRSKLLEDFEITRIKKLSPALIHRLTQGAFIDRCENLLIFGNPGTGKTHLSIALAREWCLRGRRILYTTAAALVQELLAAKQNVELNEFIKKMDRYEMLIIDDISYLPYERKETDALFVLLSARYEQRSLLITSNLVFSQWDQVFKDKMTTTAAIDRLVHHSTILELNTESYRAAQAKNRQKNKGQLPNPQTPVN